MDLSVLMDLLLLVALLSAGALATICAARIFPLWLLELAQQHGRFAGLEGTVPPRGPGGGKGSAAQVMALWGTQPSAA